MSSTELLRCTTPEAAAAAVRRWLATELPADWRDAAERGGPSAVRAVRSPDEYRSWYPSFAESGLVVPQWPAEYGGLDWSRPLAKAAESVLSAYHLPRLNPLGLNSVAPALFAHGTHEQRLRFLPPMVENKEVWCQLMSEPGAGSDLASLATRAVRDGDSWRLTGQKVWTTWAHLADWALCLARTDVDVPKHQGITYFLVDMHSAGIEVRPLKHIGGEIDFNEVFLDDVIVPDSQRVGEVHGGWAVTRATLSGERQMGSGAGSGGVDRIGGSGAAHLVSLARANGDWEDLRTRDRIVRVWMEEQIRGWTNARVREDLAAGLAPGPGGSIGKIAGAELNQRIQSLAAELIGDRALAWEGEPDSYAESMPTEVRGMLRSRANTIEGGTSEVNRTILAERVLGLPKEPDPWQGKPWREVPRG